METPLPQLGELIEERLALLRRLAESLEISQLALVRNDAEAIARGAAHQAALCRQWSMLEEQLRKSGERGVALAQGEEDGSSEAQRSARLQAEWETLGERIRHLTRVHCSLLRHLQRSLAVLNRVMESCAPTYTPEAGLLQPDARLRAGE